MKLRTRLVAVVTLAVVFGGGYFAGRSRRTLAPAPMVLVALEPTPVPLGSRQLFPVFWRGDGHTFEVQLRVTASGEPMSGKVPAPETSFDLVVRAPSGAKRFLERRGRLARDVPNIHTRVEIPEGMSNPPLASRVELLETFVYEAPAGQTETLEVEVAPVTGRDVAGATAEVRVYELARVTLLE